MVYSTTFEEAIVKIPFSRIKELTSSRTRPVRLPLKNGDKDSERNADRPAKRFPQAQKSSTRRTSRHQPPMYLYLSFIGPNYSFCGRLFLAAWYASRCRCRGKQPACIRNKLFFWANRMEAFGRSRNYEVKHRINCLDAYDWVVVLRLVGLDKSL